MTKAEFEDFYERIVASATVKGLLRKDVLVLAISEEDKTSFSMDRTPTMQNLKSTKATREMCSMSI